MPAAFRLVGVSLLLVACATEREPKLKRTADGTTLVGRIDSGFRIAAYGTDFTMKSPRDWRVLLCTEGPLNANVVCASPDGKSFASINVWDASPGAHVTAAATEHAEAKAYLRELHRFKDPDIKMTREPDIALPDGRQVPVWRYFLSIGASISILSFLQVRR